MLQPREGSGGKVDGFSEQRVVQALTQCLIMRYWERGQDYSLVPPSDSSAIISSL